MRNPVEIENIEQRRQLVGIDDVELREAIRGLAAGDFVRITLVSGTGSCETLPVRITSIRGASLRGKLARGPSCAGLSRFRAGSPVAFTREHIHSIAQRRAAGHPAARRP